MLNSLFILTSIDFYNVIFFSFCAFFLSFLLKNTPFLVPLSFLCCFDIQYDKLLCGIMLITMEIVLTYWTQNIHSDSHSGGYREVCHVLCFCDFEEACLKNRQNFIFTISLPKYWNNIWYGSHAFISIKWKIIPKFYFLCTSNKCNAIPSVTFYWRVWTVKAPRDVKIRHTAFYLTAF